MNHLIKKNIINKRSMIKTLIKILIKVTLIIVGVIGIILNALSSKFMGGSSVFLFFTVQSNITIIVMSLVFLILDLILIFKNKEYKNQILYFLKYIFTIAITITFIVFFALLAPIMGIDYVLSFKNFSVHLIVPVLAIIDFYLYDYDINLSLKSSLFGLAMPIYYVFFVFIGVLEGFRYGGEDIKFPYFFLDYETNGWLFEKGMGVIIWILILVAGIIGLCFLFHLLMKIRKKHVKGENNHE